MSGERNMHTGRRTLRIIKVKLNELLMMKPYRKIERVEQDMYKIGG